LAIPRRAAIATVLSCMTVRDLGRALAADESVALDALLKDPFNARPRSMMNYAPLIPGDYYFTFGTVPPRSISQAATKQPEWNAFGACVDNSCTYVPIAQRYAGYTKYEPRLSRGLRDYQSLGFSIKRQDWPMVAAAVVPIEQGIMATPTVDALLKAGLLAPQMLVSPNNLRERRDVALATFYVNEVDFAIREIRKAASVRDAEAAMAAWQFGADSWNSYLSVINPRIVPKVGEPLEPIQTRL